MTKRIHIVGLSPRTGTTLMAELLATSYAIEGPTDHEMSIFEQPPANCAVFFSKLPGDLLVMPWLLRFDPNLWVINMVRDPRDVVVSRHARDPSAYWVHLGVWKERRRVAARLGSHPRFVEVRYEDLVRKPMAVQEEIERRISFLERTHDFHDFHQRASPPSGSREAMGRVRPIDTASLGNWRGRKPRLVAQMRRHGDIDEGLRAYGYETDATWTSELAGVTPDNGRTHFPERRPLRQRARTALRRVVGTARYAQRLHRKNRRGDP